MPSQGIATTDLIALTREMSGLVTPNIVQVFNQAAAREEKTVMNTLLRDEHALRQEMGINPKLTQAFSRMLCLNILERIDYGMDVVINHSPTMVIRDLHAKAAALNGRNRVSNETRARLLDIAGAPRLASIMRQNA